MYLKHYTAVPQQVPDPMRPGRTAKVTRLIDSGAQDPIEEEGQTYLPDENGWYNFPEHVGARLRTFRDRGSGWFGQAEVADQVRLGGMDQMDRPAVRVKTEKSAKRGPGRPRKTDPEE